MNFYLEKQRGEVNIEVDTTVYGEINGDIVVFSGAKLDLVAPVKGDVRLMKFSKASIRSLIYGNLYNEGAAELELSGTINGKIINIT